MRIKKFLRLVLAIIFALTAFIFTEVLPEIPPFNRIFLRILITLWFGLMGYGLFPDIAKVVTTATINLINSLVTRVSSEVTTQMLRLQRQNPFHTTAAYPSNAPIGGVSVNQPLILDTSAIIDGRILDIARTSFLYGTILVPSFVLAELQQVADSADYIKRSRGRRGFEIIEELKKAKGIRIEVWDKEPLAKTVDDKLIKLAKNLHGRIITTDYNLNRVATVSSVTVLNINDLANAVKTVAVPGEGLEVKVIHLGKDPKQGVGYLPDGTMIVVEDGANLVGKEIKTEVSRVLQSSAGRMIFTRTSR
ncbi:MAG: hypothetical protein Q7S44_03345 [bacterium]|nr:hypothetical protein [bacterium]